MIISLEWPLSWRAARSMLYEFNTYGTRAVLNKKVFASLFPSIKCPWTEQTRLLILKLSLDYARCLLPTYQHMWLTQRNWWIPQRVLGSGSILIGSMTSFLEIRFRGYTSNVRRLKCIWLISFSLMKIIPKTHFGYALAILLYWSQRQGLIASTTHLTTQDKHSSMQSLIKFTPTQPATQAVWPRMSLLRCHLVRWKRRRKRLIPHPPSEQTQRWAYCLRCCSEDKADSPPRW